MANPLPMQSLEVSDFSGGMSDFYVAGQPNKCQLADNFAINEDRKLITRPGSKIQNVTMPRIPAEARVAKMSVFDGEQFHFYARDAYLRGTVAWTTLLGPSGNPVFSSGSAGSFHSTAEWNSHLIATNDGPSYVQKIFKDEAGVYRSRELGLPDLDLSGAIYLANEIKSRFNAHILSVRHSVAIDSVNTILSADAVDYDTLLTLVNELTTKYNTHEADSGLPSGRLYHPGLRAANRQLASNVAPQSLSEIITRLNDLRDKYIAHDADATAHAAGTLNAVTRFLAPQFARSAGSNTYIYAFHFAYQYRVGSLTFRESGPVKYIEVGSSAAPDVSSVTFSSLPILANGSIRNLDTANIKIEVYRTKASGTTFYFLGEVTNGTTTYVDSRTDTGLENQKTIYTSGGILDNTPPPQCKYLAQTNDVFCFANVKEAGETRPNGFTLSKRGQPFSAPFREAVDNEILGVGVAQSGYIIFCKGGKIIRVDGSYDALGRGSIRKKELTRTVELASDRSIVQTLEGLFFAALDGFYFCSGYDVVKISEDIPETYKTLVQNPTMASRIYGVYDSGRNRVLWACSNNTSSPDNNVIFVAHLRFGVKPDTPFTTWTGNFSPSAMVFRDKKLIVGERRGYLLEFDESYTTDPEIDTTLLVTQWKTKAIIYDYRSCAFDFGTTLVRKWVSKLTVTANNESALSLAIFSSNDNSGSFKELAEVRYDGRIFWGDPLVAWGDTDVRWNYLPVIDAWRRFPAQGLRCSMKQIRFTNSFTVIDTSLDNAVADVDSAAKTVTLQANTWPFDADNYFISFDTDNYVREYLVTSRTDTTLTYVDANNTTLSATGANWRLRGYRKSEIFNLLSYVLYYSLLTTTQSKYTTEAAS